MTNPKVARAVTMTDERRQPLNCALAPAIATLRELSSGLTYVSKQDEFAFLALVVTLLVRPTIAGPCPLFLVESPESEVTRALWRRLQWLASDDGVPVQFEGDSHGKQVHGAFAARAPLAILNTGAKRIASPFVNQTVRWTQGTVWVMLRNGAKVTADTAQHALPINLRRGCFAAWLGLEDRKSFLLAAETLILAGRSGSSSTNPWRGFGFETWNATVLAPLCAAVRLLAPNAKGEP